MNDQELDKLMRQVAADASLDDAAADDIADSPTLWWNVQSEIRKATPATAPWPPNYLRRWLMIAVPVAASLLIGLGIYLTGLRTTPVQTGKIVEPSTPATTSNAAHDIAPPQPPAPIADVSSDGRTKAKPAKAVIKRAAIKPQSLMAHNV